MHVNQLRPRRHKLKMALVTKTTNVHVYAHQRGDDPIPTTRCCRLMSSQSIIFYVHATIISSPCLMYKLRVQTVSIKHALLQAHFHLDYTYRKCHWCTKKKLCLVFRKAHHSWPWRGLYWTTVIGMVAPSVFSGRPRPGKKSPRLCNCGRYKQL